MKPIPVKFNIGPLQIHTYGIGLAVTFWFAYRYFDRRLRARGYDTEWLPRAFVWIIVAAIVGARTVHVLANLDIYSADPKEILAIWHGGLSSFGGLGLGSAVGIWQIRRNCPALRTVVALDVVAPVLMAAWGIGRLLGPQLMVAGGGRPTTSWYGMYYAEQIGKRLPAPIFQSIESFAVFGALVLLERQVAKRSWPDGMIIAGMAAFWGLARFLDELFWLDVNPPFDAVEVTGVVMSAAGFVAMGLLVLRAARGTARGTALSGDDVPDDPDAPRAPEDVRTPPDQATADVATDESTSP